MIHFTCALAENVSAKVRELDIAKVFRHFVFILVDKQVITVIWFILFNVREEFQNAKRG